MIPILTFKPVLIGCQYGLFVVYGAFYLVNQLMCWPRTTLTEIARRDAVFVTFSHPF